MFPSFEIDCLTIGANIGSSSSGEGKYPSFPVITELACCSPFVFSSTDSFSVFRKNSKYCRTVGPPTISFIIINSSSLAANNNLLYSATNSGLNALICRNWLTNLCAFKAEVLSNVTLRLTNAFKI